MAIPTQSLCALEASERKFIFFADKTKQLVFYERGRGVGGSEYTRAGYVDEDGKNVTLTSRFINGVVYDSGNQLRIYYTIEDENTGNSLLRESCAYITGTDPVKWTQGSLNRFQFYLKKDSLLTAMSTASGYPMVVFQQLGSGKLYQAYITLDQTATTNNKEKWSADEVILTPSPNANV